MGSADVQGRLWGGAARDWLVLERFGLPFYEAVFDAVNLSDRHHLLDVGCGAGLALQIAAARGAGVTGIDAADGLLEVARERVPHADLRRGELESLPYQGDAFDVITSFNAVQFAADPVVALRETKRVAKPGGQVVAVTWGAPERCESAAIFAAVARVLLPPPPGAVGPFALSEPGQFEELLSAAGLTPTHAAEVQVPWVFPDLDSAVRALLSTGPLRQAVGIVGAPAARDVLVDAFAPARQPDGSYRHDNVFRYVISTA